MTIPLLDATSPSFAADVVNACDDIGFFAVTGHGIDPALFQRMRHLCAQVFCVDESTKRSHQITPTNYRGFIPLGFFTPNRAEVNGAEPDRYEGFKLHWECAIENPVTTDCVLYGPNRWLATVPSMEATITTYWHGCERFAARLLDIVADELILDREQFHAWHTEPLTNMTLLHYPESTAVDQNAVAGIHAHKDTNVFTLLHPDPVGGLEVRTSDQGWVSVDTPSDALLVNTGEMVELWSGGRFAATPHRVVNATGQRRYSFPWFQVPRHDVVVEPLVDCIDGFSRAPMPVGELSAEVWRTNWPDERPSTGEFDLGALDRTTNSTDPTAS